MNAIEKNDSIILKGTNFESKPVFANFTYPKFDDLIRHLMFQYGESITDGQPLKGREVLHWDVGQTHRSRPVPIPLQPYFRPFFDTMLLVVGSDDSDVLVLTSPIEENVRKLFGFHRWSRTEENHDDMLQVIEDETEFIPLTYNCSTTEMKKGWQKKVHLRKYDTVELYVVPKPLEYFPMLFINCSMENSKRIYENVTALMRSRNDRMYYRPFLFTCVLFRPLIFRSLETHIEYRQRLPGIDVTDEEFLKRRTEWLCCRFRYLVSDCRCRSNTAILPPNYTFRQAPSWDNVERLFYAYNYSTPSEDPPHYTVRHSNCTGNCDN